jgi:hypothetical protein
MNDDELITAVRDSFTGVRSATPAERIISRSRAVRAQRRIPVVTAATVGAAAAVAVAVTLPASHAAASHPAASRPASSPGAQLAAWTVTRHADGTIQIRFFGELRDPAALQATLRADGVPASVTYIGQQNPACQPFPDSGGPPPSQFRSLGKPFLGPLSKVVPPFVNKNLKNQQDAVMVINPSALPPGAGLQIAVMRGIPPGPAGPWPYQKGSGHPVTEVGLVKTSPQCTGS